MNNEMGRRIIMLCVRRRDVVRFRRRGDGIEMGLGGLSHQAVEYLENLLNRVWFVRRGIELDAGVVTDRGIEHELIISNVAVLGDCRILGTYAIKQGRVVGSLRRKLVGGRRRRSAESVQQTGIVIGRGQRSIRSCVRGGLAR